MVLCLELIDGVKEEKDTVEEAIDDGKEILRSTEADQQSRTID